MLYASFFWPFGGSDEEDDTQEEEDRQFDDSLVDDESDGEQNRTETQFLDTEQSDELEQGSQPETNGGDGNKFEEENQIGSDGETDNGEDPAEFVVEDAGESEVELEDEKDGEEDDFEPDVVRSADPDGDGRRRGENIDTFMELVEIGVTEKESPDPNATAREMLPEQLPGWDRQKVDKDRWPLQDAEDWITATFVDFHGDRYMVHVSRWEAEFVEYVMEELFTSLDDPFDVHTARGKFIFAVDIIGGTVNQAETLLSASPALSKYYLGIDEEKEG